MTTLQREVDRFLQVPGARLDPRALYDRLVTEAPVFPLDASGTAWLVSGYDEIVALSTHPGVITEFSRSGMQLDQGFTLAPVLERMLPLRSGADHARLRRLVNAAFSARAARRLQQQVRLQIELLLAPGLRAGGFDVTADLARPLPVAVSCAMLDVPEAERPQVAAWAQLIAATLLVSETTPAVRSHVYAELEQLRDYVTTLCARRAARPGEDLISHLVAARAAGTLDDDELFAFVVMLFVNGLDTLTSGLSVAVWHVLQHPEMIAVIAARPELAEAVFDECLRLGGPVRASGRTVVEDVRVGDTTIRSGGAVLLLYAAANRDRRYFPDPDALRLDRAQRHLAFGFGPHHCLGAPLSLLVGAEVLRFLVRHCPDLTTALTPETAPWQTSLPFAGLTALPVTFRPRPSSPLEDTLPVPDLAGVAR